MLSCFKLNLFSACSAAIIHCHGAIDLNTNGVSEIWELIYPQVEVDGNDPDMDGFSNREEAIAGTNPLVTKDCLKLEIKPIGEGELEFTWNGIAGKLYAVEKWSEDQWVEVAQLIPNTANERRKLVLPETSGSVFRLKASDLDGDQDGLTAWEEFQLGWSDGDQSSSGEIGRLDYAAAIRRMEHANGAVLADGRTLSRYVPSRLAASRFLMQASFGPTSSSIDQVQEMGMSGWIDRQTALTPSSSRTSMFSTGLSYQATLWKDGWAQLAVKSEDQLRQRMAYALSQLFVVGFQGGTWVGDNPLVQASYYDQFIDGAFGSYRNILGKVTYSPVMGFYLSHLRNRKSDPAIGRFPDENFAREIMQLFSIGLWELNQDGSRRLDENGDEIPTYDNEVITEMAKVFTGLSFSRDSSSIQEVEFFEVVGGNAYLYPMKMFPEEHELGKKVLLNGVVLSDLENGGEDLTADEEVEATLDMLAAHGNTAPFICRFLIQRFTCSNPSPAYIQRVTQVWRSNVENGNFEKVIEAILLDPEIRSEVQANGGKVREPVIRLTNLLRAFDFKNTSGELPLRSGPRQEEMGQYPMLSPTVFNFYLPNYSPPGELSDLRLFSPELQIAGISQLINTDNLFRNLIDQDGFSIAPELDTIESQNLAPDALLDLLEELLCGTKLQEETRRLILEAMTSEVTSLNQIKTAIHLVAASAESSVLK